MTFKDGINTGKPKKNKNLLIDFKKEHTFTSLVRLLDHIAATGDYSYLQHIMDPFAIMLILGIKQKLDLPDYQPNPAHRREQKCELVWNVLNGNNPNKLRAIMIKMDPLEQHYLRIIAKGEHPEGITSKTLIWQLAQYRRINFNDAYHTWILQPDPEIMAYELLANCNYPGDITKSPQRVTPAAGYPIHLMYPLGSDYDIRFPCIIQPYRVGQRVQIHKSLSDIRIFDESHRQISIPEIEEEIRKYKDDGIIDAMVHRFKDNKGEEQVLLEGLDLLQLNDVWIIDRQLGDRANWFWRFYPTFGMNQIAKNKKEFNEAVDMFDHRPLLVRNLNTNYCPINRKAWIIHENDGIVQAKIRKTKGTSRITLESEDGKRLFVFGTLRISETEIGKVVDVTRDGVVLKHRPELAKAQDFREIAKKWGVKEPQDLIVEGVWPKKIRWRKINHEK